MVQFRKSKSLGPFRVTASKRGFSTSAGVKGARVSLGSDGKVRRTVGLPGTGVYDTKVLGKAITDSPGKSTPAADPAGPEKERLAGWFADAPAWLVDILSHPSSAPPASKYQRAYVVTKLGFKVDEKHLMDMRLDHAVAVLSHLGIEPKALRQQSRDGFGGAETKARKQWWKAQGV